MAFSIQTPVDVDGRPFIVSTGQTGDIYSTMVFEVVNGEPDFFDRYSATTYNRPDAKDHHYFVVEQLFKHNFTYGIDHQFADEWCFVLD